MDMVSHLPATEIEQDLYGDGKPSFMLRQAASSCWHVRHVLIVSEQ